MLYKGAEHYGELGEKAYSLYSQMGEDGIIEEIFKRLKIDKGTFLEVGAQDGINLSNTRRLYDKGWRGVYIETFIDDYIRLVRNTPNAQCFRSHINCELETLDSFLKLAGFDSLDLLSLDIDGIEYYVWDSMVINPLVVVVEYNSNYPLEDCKSIKYDPKFSWEVTRYFGATLGAFEKIAKKKGYTLVAAVYGLNLFYVRNDVMAHFKPLDPSVLPIVQNFREDHREMVDV